MIKNSTELQVFEESPEYKDYKDIDQYEDWGIFKVFIHKNDMKSFKEIYNKYTDPNLLITLY